MKNGANILTYMVYVAIFCYMLLQVNPRKEQQDTIEELKKTGFEITKL